MGLINGLLAPGNGTSSAAVFDDFDRADGALGTSASGDVWLTTGAGTPVISGGKLVASTLGTAYAMLDVGDDVAVIGAEFTIESGAVSEVLALLTGAGPTVPDVIANCLHIVVKSDYWALQKRIANVQTTQASGVLALAADGTTVHRVEVSRDRDLVVISINGAVVGAHRDPDYATLPGHFVIWEPVKTAGSQEPRFTRIWAHTPTSGYPGAAPTAVALGEFLDQHRPDIPAGAGYDLMARKDEATQVLIGRDPTSGYAAVVFGASENAALYSTGANDLRTAGSIRVNAAGTYAVLGAISGGTGLQLGADVALRRTVANCLAMAAGDAFAPGSTTTAGRPAANSLTAGSMLYDSDLGKLILTNGTAWVNLDGSAL